ncbi:hypothetical protein BKA81DRAFT_378312 [Phyllosticta paracitricarpa]
MLYPLFPFLSANLISFYQSGELVQQLQNVLMTPSSSFIPAKARERVGQEGRKHVVVDSLQFSKPFERVQLTVRHMCILTTWPVPFSKQLRSSDRHSTMDATPISAAASMCQADNRAAGGTICSAAQRLVCVVVARLLRQEAPFGHGRDSSRSTAEPRNVPAPAEILGSVSIGLEGWDRDGQGETATALCKRHAYGGGPEESCKPTSSWDTTMSVGGFFGRRRAAW